MNAVFGTPGEQRVVDVVERERLLDVVAELVDRDVVALVVHAVRFDARAQVGLVAAALGLHRVARAARRIDRMCSARYFARAGEKPRSRRIRGMSFANASAVGYFLRVTASSSASAVAGRREREPQIVRLELAAELGLDLLRDVGAERRLEDLDEHRADARLGQLGAVERAVDVGRRDRRVRIDRARRVEVREHALEPLVGLAGRRSARWRDPSAHRPRSRRPATVTLFVNGSQSSVGLSITAAGIVCVTIRSITFAIVRCFARPSLSA